jgi:hypothetical protein
LTKTREPAPEGTIRLGPATRGKRYKRIKIGGRWEYLHRYLMEQHLGRSLGDNEYVTFKKGVDPASEFTLDDLLLGTRNTPSRLEKISSMKKDIASAKMMAWTVMRELAALEDKDPDEIPKPNFEDPLVWLATEED